MRASATDAGKQARNVAGRYPAGLPLALVTGYAEALLGVFGLEQGLFFSRYFSFQGPAEHVQRTL